MDRVLVAMSGGVDSSAAAALLKQAGYPCVGAMLQMWGQADTADARQVAQRLGMDFYEYDAREAFEASVVCPFIESYEAGLTPNPCMVCNKTMKFGWLLDKADELGCRYIATGHYARIVYDATTDRYLLKKALDPAKDQTYFLACLSQAQLSRILLPLGGLTKEEARRIAEENSFCNARKRDSQDICFIPDGDYATFIATHTGKDFPTGSFVDMAGNVVGSHRGAIRYTIGQRKGLGLAMGSPVYVCGKDMQAQTVTVGPNEALFTCQLTAGDWNWHIPCPDAPLRVKARIRYRHTEQPATVYPAENGIATVVFDQPQRAITPGQALVLYDDDTVLACATIL